MLHDRLPNGITDVCRRARDDLVDMISPALQGGAAVGNLLRPFVDPCDTGSGLPLTWLTMSSIRSRSKPSSAEASYAGSARGRDRSSACSALWPYRVASYRGINIVSAWGKVSLPIEWLDALDDRHGLTGLRARRCWRLFFTRIAGISQVSPSSLGQPHSLHLAATLAGQQQ